MDYEEKSTEKAEQAAGIPSVKEGEHYRSRIMEMIKGMDNPEWLRFIYRLVKNLTE